jgi:hypothetical protein
LTWTYSGDPTTTSKDEVRFLVGDTDTEDPLVSDEEIQYTISTWYPVYGTYFYVASVVAESIAGKLARETSYSADGVSIDLGSLQQKFSERAAQLRQAHHSLLVGGTPDVGGISPYEQLDYLTKPLDFGTGMHDNPEAGQQAYGEYGDRPYYDPHNYPGT